MANKKKNGLGERHIDPDKQEVMDLQDRLLGSMSAYDIESMGLDDVAETEEERARQLIRSGVSEKVAYALTQKVGDSSGYSHSWEEFQVLADELNFANEDRVFIDGPLGAIYNQRVVSSFHAWLRNNEHYFKRGIWPAGRRLKKAYKALLKRKDIRNIRRLIEVEELEGTPCHQAFNRILKSELAGMRMQEASTPQRLNHILDAFVDENSPYRTGEVDEGHWDDIDKQDNAARIGDSLGRLVSIEGLRHAIATDPTVKALVLYLSNNFSNTPADIARDPEFDSLPEDRRAEIIDSIADLTRLADRMENVYESLIDSPRFAEAQEQIDNTSNLFNQVESAQSRLNRYYVNGNGGQLVRVNRAVVEHILDYKDRIEPLGLPADDPQITAWNARLAELEGDREDLWNKITAEEDRLLEGLEQLVESSKGDDGNIDDSYLYLADLEDQIDEIKEGKSKREKLIPTYSIGNITAGDDVDSHLPASTEMQDYLNTVDYSGLQTDIEQLHGALRRPSSLNLDPHELLYHLTYEEYSDPDSPHFVTDLTQRELTAAMRVQREINKVGSVSRQGAKNNYAAQKEIDFLPSVGKVLDAVGLSLPARIFEGKDAVPLNQVVGVITELVDGTKPLAEIADCASFVEVRDLIKNKGVKDEDVIKFIVLLENFFVGLKAKGKSIRLESGRALRVENLLEALELAIEHDANKKAVDNLSRKIAEARRRAEEAGDDAGEAEEITRIQGITEVLSAQKNALSVGRDAAHKELLEKFEHYYSEEGEQERLDKLRKIRDEFKANNPLVKSAEENAVGALRQLTRWLFRELAANKEVKKKAEEDSEVLDVLNTVSKMTRFEDWLVRDLLSDKKEKLKNYWEGSKNTWARKKLRGLGRKIPGIKGFIKDDD